MRGIKNAICDNFCAEQPEEPERSDPEPARNNAAQPERAARPARAVPG